MTVINVSPSEARAAFTRIQSLLKSETGREDFIINQKTLRVEQELSASKNTYTFDLKETNASDRPLEKKLKTNDLFFMTHLALCLTKQDTSTTPKQYGNFVLHTNPDPNVFVGDDSSNPLEHVALETIYNGSLSLKTSPLERLSSFDTSMFRFVPERPHTVDYSNPDQHPQYGPSMEERGYFALTPNIIIDGDDNNTLQLELGAGDTTLIAGAVNAAGNSVNTRNVVVLLAHGFQVVGGAQKLGRWTAR